MSGWWMRHGPELGYAEWLRKRLDVAEGCRAAACRFLCCAARCASLRPPARHAHDFFIVSKLPLIFVRTRLIQHLAHLIFSNASPPRRTAHKARRLEIPHQGAKLTSPTSPVERKTTTQRCFYPDTKYL